MQITVDTKHDSQEDIRKVIQMLKHLVGGAVDIKTNLPSGNLSEGIMNMFNSDNEIPKESKKDSPDIELY